MATLRSRRNDYAVLHGPQNPANLGQKKTHKSLNIEYAPNRV